MRCVIRSTFGASIDGSKRSYVWTWHVAHLTYESIFCEPEPANQSILFPDTVMPFDRESDYAICRHPSGRYIIQELRADGRLELLVGSFDSAAAAERWVLGRSTKCSGAARIAELPSAISSGRDRKTVHAPSG